MPLIQISLRQGQNADYTAAISAALQQALLETFGVAATDSVFIINEYTGQGLIFDPNFAGTARSDALLVVQITCNLGRTAEMKRALYARAAALLALDPGVSPANLVINLTEVPAENWSFAGGQMSSG